jgi:acyl-CoA synthetase (AMP-forming)/AMP-acid ligase II
MTNRVLTLLSHERLTRTYALGHWRDDTIFSLAKAHAQKTPDKVAVRDSGGALTYKDLVASADALAGALQEGGLRQGDRVAVWLSSRIETAVALIACSRNGYACCPSLHRDHMSGDVIELLRRMRASAFIGEIGYGADGGRANIFDRLEQVETLKKSFALSAAGVRPDKGLPFSNADNENPVNSDPNVLVYLAFTSGTTGRPKGVMHSDNTLLAAARAMIRDWRFDDKTVIYTMSPLSHNLGLGSLVMALATGGELVIHDVPRGKSTLDRIVEVGATFVVGVPTHAVDLLAEIKSRNIVPKNVKGFRISGASAPREIVAELLRYGVVPQSGYGMTEAGSHHYTRIDDDADRIVQTSGRPCDGYEVKIWSTDRLDVEAPVGEIGQIGGRGASLMLGYFDDQPANDKAFNASGWFMTGDLGRVDKDGYIQITGRKKDLIIRGGHNIFPARIENLAMQHPAVMRAAALPVPDHRLGEKVCLAVELRPGQQLDPFDLLSHLDQLGLSRYDMPEYFLRLDSIPLTASGKIRKIELIEQVAAGKIAPQPVRWAPPKAAS